MQPLDRSLRRELERTIQKAREVAEQAAGTALSQLGVGEAKPYDYLDDDQRDLRRRLRVHGRQLGDELQGGRQETIRLQEEVAYEHWHRMLFARFLAENNLLMYPDPVDPVPVTLAECEDLAEMEGLKNGWEVAARYAGKMLPQIFREASPVFELTLPPEYQQQMEQLLADLSPEVFTAQDSLGWVYQFWQAKKKDEVNASEVKIGARELPAVTQLFTEPYMVSFLLDNSLGAWWAARRLSEDDLKNATSEAELREKASIDGVSLDYLRFVQDEETGAWTPAAGTFDSWPETLAELKTLDPCCGSGHFLVAALLMLTPMRQELEGLSPQDAVDAVLRQNLHGLELDQRCVEIAAFALALEAWRYDGAGGYRPLPELNLACSGMPITVREDYWVSLADKNKNLEIALADLYQQFSDAEYLGSLIDPSTSLQAGTLFERDWNEIEPLLEQALELEADFEKRETGVVAQGIVRVAQMLTQSYSLVITNVPFKETKQLHEKIQEYIHLHYSEGYVNLATAFVIRIKKLLRDNGTAAIVTPHEWLFLVSYKSTREYLLKKANWNSLVDLGERAFESSQAAGAFTALVSFTNREFDKSSQYLGIDATKMKGAQEKEQYVITGESRLFKQIHQLQNPDYRIGLFEHTNLPLLSKSAGSYVGLQNGDTPRYVFNFWEMGRLPKDAWELFQLPCDVPRHYNGREGILRWENGKGALSESDQARIQGTEAWERRGVAIRQTRTLPATLYNGNLYDQSSAVIVPENDKLLKAIWTYCSDQEFHDDVRKIDKKKNVTNATLVKIPFDLEHWQQVAEERYPNGLPAPYSNDSTQWLFHGHPCGSVVWDEDEKALTHGALRTDDTVLQVAVARLLSYRWPAELDDEMELSAESREWVSRSADLLEFADKDGIVCIPSVRGERPADERLLNLLAAAYGDDWNNDVLSQLLSAVDHAGKTLETWLRDKFFQQHCAMFNNRPFIWHIWDGLRDGFAALVNYHTLDYKGLETLIYTYLGDWISRQKRDIASGVDGAQEKLAAAEALKKRLEQILEGENPYDIFIRWKPLEEQPIGWHPDLNDGVLINIRPFMTVQDVGNKGAGVLRYKPNIKWTKDRGRDVETAPWYHLGPEYGGKKGDRINDHHLSLAEKQAAREKKKV